MSQELEREKIKGKYNIVVAIIPAVAGLLIAIIGGAKYAPVEVNVNLDSYMSKVRDEIISQQNIDAQKEYDKLYGKIAELQDDNETQLLQISALEQEKEELLDRIAENERLIDTLKSSANVSDTPNETPKGTVKLTSLQVLGNNEKSFNYVNNSRVTDDDAKSSLGEVFNSSISMGVPGNIDFYLGNGYQTLNTTICISESTKNIDYYSSTLTMYKVEGNGSDETLEVIYTSPALTMGFISTKTEPINVSGVEHLRISLDSDRALNNIPPRIILGNPMLTPK